MGNDWVALCGEVHPDSQKRCVKKKDHEGFHNTGDGRGWMPWSGWDHLCELHETDVLPETWNLNVTPYPYNEQDDFQYDLGPNVTQIVDFLNGYP